MEQEGKLFFDGSTGRYDILFTDGSVYGGLHCGDCFDFLSAGDWKPTRIEMYSDCKEWYLVDCRGITLDGLTVRLGSSRGRFVCE
jgi:hypothetical protein